MMLHTKYKPTDLFIVPSSQEGEPPEGSELHLHFTPSQPAESQSVGVSEMVSRLETLSQGTTDLAIFDTQ